MRVTKRQRLDVLTWALILGFVMWALLFIAHTSFRSIDGRRYFALFDDAMISMRYAWNLAHGHGLVWNPGERVEGYTNLLMVLLMAVPNAILEKRLAVLAVQVSGVVFVVLSALLAGQIGRLLNPDEGQSSRVGLRPLCVVGVLGYYPLAYWSLLGMETGLLTVLVLGAVWCALTYANRRQDRVLVAMAVLLGLGYWTRPESALLAALLIGYVWWDARLSWPRAAGTAAAYAMFLVAQHSFRWWYYGELFANTYTLKLAGMPLGARLRDGVAYIVPFLNEHLLILVVIALGTLLHFNRRKLLLVTMVFGMIVYQVYVGGDPWPYWRITAPIMPLALALFAHEALAAAAHIARMGGFRTAPSASRSLVPVRWVPFVLALIAVLLALRAANFRFWREQTLVDRAYLVYEASRNVDLAVALEDVTAQDATVGVIWAGIIPYYTERPGVDFLGKSDPFIAQLPPDTSGESGWNGLNSVPGHNKYDLAYSIRTLRPTFVQDLRWGRDDLYDWGAGHYVAAHYRGVILYLLDGSPDVYWERLDAVGPVSRP